MKINAGRAIIVIYFIIAIIEVIAEAFENTLLIVIFKPLIPTVLIWLYLYTSTRRNVVFVVTMALSVLTNLLFIPNTEQMLLYAIITFLVHRVLVIYMIFSLVRIHDFVPLVIGTVPFLLIFFYLFMISDIPENSFLILIIQNLLISVVGGVAVSTYIMQDSKRNSWLLLCGLLFVLLHLIIFIEKYYLSQLSPAVMRPIAMGLNVIAFYTFYEFVITAERSDDDHATVGGNAFIS